MKHVPMKTHSKSTHNVCLILIHFQCEIRYTHKLMVNEFDPYQILQKCDNMSLNVE